MKRNTIVAGSVSRRALLRGLVTCAGLYLLPATTLAAVSESSNSAIAFDSNALIIARGSLLLYRDRDRNWITLPEMSAGSELLVVWIPAGLFCL